MFMDPHQSQQHAGLQHVILQVQHEISRPKESFKLLQLLCFPNSLNFVFFSQKNESNAGIDVAQNNQWMGPNETLDSPHLYSDSSSMLVICCLWCRFVVLGVHLLFWYYSTARKSLSKDLRSIPIWMKNVVIFWCLKSGSHDHLSLSLSFYFPGTNKKNHLN